MKCLFFLLAFSVFQTSEANSGLPTIVMFEPILIAALVPIIFIEYKIMRRHLKAIKSSILLKSVSIANLCSTFIGFPVTWTIMLALQEAYEKVAPLHRAPFEPGWLVPIIAPEEGETYTITMIMTIGLSFVFLLLTHFFISWQSEYCVNRKILSEIECKPSDIRLAVRNANLASYAFLIAIAFAIWGYKFSAGELRYGGFSLIDSYCWLWTFSYEILHWVRSFI